MLLWFGCDQRQHAMPFKPRVIVIWHGLPAYGANAVRALCAHYGADCVLCVVTVANGMLCNPHQHVPCQVVVGRSDDPGLLAAVCLDNLRLILKTGWHLSAAETLVDRSLRLPSALRPKIVMLTDTIYLPTIRKLFGPVYFRLFKLLRNHAVMVPGIRSLNYMRAFGFRERAIGTGLYFADPNVFTPAPKEKLMLFVGQLNERKGVPELLSAWARFTITHPEWKMAVFGAGAWAERVVGSTIDYQGKADSHQIAFSLGKAHALLLPSRIDHWGVVLHEAALCAALPCGSVFAGATTDLLPPEYGNCVFQRVTEREIYARLVLIAGLWGSVDRQLVRERALQFTKEKFISELQRITVQ